MPIISFSSISLLAAVAVDLVLGFIIYANAKAKRNGFFFSSISFSVALWALVRFFFETISVQSVYLRIVTESLYVVACLIPLFFVFFTYTFPEEEAVLDYRNSLLISLPALLIMFLVMMDGFIIREINQSLSGYKIITFGEGYLSYGAYIVFYFLWGYVRLIRKYFKNDGIIKVQIAYVLVGTLITTVSGLSVNLIAPALGSFRFFWLGPVTSIAMSLTIAYAIVRHHLLDIKIVATEIFALLIVSVFFGEVFLSQSGKEIAIRIALLGMVTFFSFLLVKGVLKDVESREYAEKLAKELELANEHLRVLDKQKSEFVSIASHQLRTPLTAIIGYSSMLLEGSYGKLSDKAAEVVDKVYESSRRLAGTIDDFLTISHIEQGKMVYTFSTVEMRGLLSGMVEEFSTRAKNEKKELRFTDDGNGNYNVTADDNKIRQVLSNLIDNAIKYSKEGQSVEVSLTKDFMTNKTRISIHDSGIGMSPETISNLFQKFNRAKDVQKTYADGNGIGLYIAQEMMKSHHGKIWAESEGEGKGATFFVELMSEE
ncbi:MAG: ATP-binding protein [Candidatus Parcubacteria bacterium]|nr:ATP-binding protein [Candidatus Parcubacteria bacterium]